MKNPSKYFLIEYNRLSGQRSIVEFDDPQEATAARFAAEEKLGVGKGWEVVVISTASLDTLKISHARYFSTEELNGAQVSLSKN